MKRKTYQSVSRLVCTVLMMLAGFCACQTNPEKPVRFAIASDFHAPDIPDGEQRVAALYPGCQRRKCGFHHRIGDFCRLDSASQVYRDLWNSFPGGKHHVIGNHDMDRYTYKEYTQGMNMPGRYYSFDQGDFHFIVLDGNNLFDGKGYTHYAKSQLLCRCQEKSLYRPRTDGMAEERPGSYR